MKRRKKVVLGDVRAGALSWFVRGDKRLKTSFRRLSPLTATVGRCAPHSHPRHPKKKVASRKKVGFAEKKLRLQKSY